MKGLEEKYVRNRKEREREREREAGVAELSMVSMAEVIALFLSCYYVYRGCQLGNANAYRSDRDRLLTDPLMILSLVNEICK